MKRLLFSITILILGLQFVIPVQAEESPPIKIGSILILSGEGSSWGVAARNGLDMAADKINATGGVLGRKIKLVHQDDQSDPKKTISAYQDLTRVESIKHIIGPTWSNLGIPLIDSATRDQVLIISPSLGMPKFNESSPYIFNTWPHDYILSQKLAEYVFNKGIRRIALFGAEDVWVKEQTEAFKARFEELGGTVAILIEPLRSTVDLRTEALKIKNTENLDAVVLTTDGVLAGSLVAKALKELNVKLPLYGITLDQAAIDAAQGGYDGMEFLTFLTPKPEFQKEYEERYKVGIDIGADSAYDALMMLAEVMRETKSTDPTTLAKLLAELKEFNGMSGKLTSDGKRGFVKPFAVKRIVGGKAEDLEK